jgi:hypothetical protein
MLPSNTHPQLRGQPGCSPITPLCVRQRGEQENRAGPSAEIQIVPLSLVTTFGTENEIIATVALRLEF